MEERPESRLPLVVAGAILAASIALFIWVISFSPWKLVPFRLAGQAYLMIAIVLAFRFWPPMAGLVRSMAVPHRVVFGVLMGAMILGHYTLNGRTFFPFVVWEIFPFVREDNPVTCAEFVATTADGKKVRLLTEQLVPSIVQIDALGGMPPETTEHLARALAKIYNEHHPDNPVRRVDLMEMAVQLHPPANESRAEPSCELLKHYDISSDH